MAENSGEFLSFLQAKWLAMLTSGWWPDDEKQLFANDILKERFDACTLFSCDPGLFPNIKHFFQL